MKYLSIIVLVFFLTSCCSTKTSVKQPVTKESLVKENLEQKEKLHSVLKNNQKTLKKGFQKKQPKKQVKQIITKPQDTSKSIASNKNKVPKLIEAFNHSAYNKLLEKHVTTQGYVNYKGFKQDRKLLTNYITLLSNNMPVNTWTKQDKLAYWINAYNALTIDLILRHYPVKSIKDIKNPWKQRFWKLGNKWYNLDEIEHQIIRKMNEPRIHFALVCAAKSCPKLYNKAFKAIDLDTNLTKLTQAFLADTSKNSITQNKLKLSKIFKWFIKDFKQNESLIGFLSRYSGIEISSSAKISYLDYNWSLNE